ncbi:MAG: DUF1080 domain-containing protein [Fuerstiella sp.]|nr:DUF1080 domain-containing protein [Fuerstiella sp.]
MKRLIVLFVVLFSPLSAIALAGDNNRVILDPEKVTPDYHIQGEYSGELDGVKHGMQVIAQGDNQFKSVVYPGGLPGDGYIGSGRIFAHGAAENGVTKISSDAGYALISDDVAKIFSDDRPLGELKRVERMGKSLGQEAPQGAIVLFDGSSADNFINGTIRMKDLLLAECESKQKFGDHRLHLEFRIPYQPYDRGQARGNSGVYIQGRYELQVLDSFGLEGENNECGGIYSIAKPKVNACFPPLTWQTYDIDFKSACWKNGEKVKNARVTIRHNGIVIHENLELKTGTPGKYPEEEGPGSLYLQGHGNQVMYRNIWVVEK